MSEKTAEHVENAKRLLAKSKEGALATLEKSGYPYVSHVEIIVTEDHRIFLFISTLAVHTRNILNDNRVSLMVHDPSAEWIISTERATFQGRMEKVEGKPDWLRELLKAKHSGAASYLDFNDFYFFELVIENVRYIKGFGEMSRFQWAKDTEK